MDEARRCTWAHVIDGAHRGGWLLDPIADREQLTVDDAYGIQRELSRIRTGRSGRKRAGWKIGFGSAAMRQQMSVDRPNFGPLTVEMIVRDGVLDVSLTHPRVEPEFAVVLREDLPAGTHLCDVGRAVASVHLAMEVVDSVWIDYRFSWEDNTADGSSAAGVVLGPELPRNLDLVDATLELSRDGQVLGRGRGGDVMSHPYAAVCWLATELPRQRESLRAGDIVLTGGVTPAVPLAPGSSFVTGCEDLECGFVWLPAREGGNDSVTS